MIPHRRRPGSTISNSRALVLSKVWHSARPARRARLPGRDACIPRQFRGRAPELSYLDDEPDQLVEIADDLPRYPGSPRAKAMTTAPASASDALDHRAGQLRAFSGRPRRGGATLRGLADHLGRDDALAPSERSEATLTALTVRHAVSMAPSRPRTFCKPRARLPRLQTGARHPHRQLGELGCLGQEPIRRRTGVARLQLEEVLR